MIKKMDQSHLKEWFWNSLDKYLDKNNLKQTRQRKKLVQKFLDLNTHVDAEMLHRKPKDIGLNIGLATVYRTLNLLQQAGLVEQHSFKDGRTVFEVSPPDEHHDHLVCVKCHKIVEFENEKIEELQDRVAEKHGFKLTAHRLDLFGICSKCSV